MEVGDPSMVLFPEGFFFVVENATLMGETHFTHGPKIMELTKVSIIHTLHILR